MASYKHDMCQHMLPSHTICLFPERQQGVHLHKCQEMDALLATVTCLRGARASRTLDRTQAVAFASE
jgi:hypothetical protein